MFTGENTKKTLFSVLYGVGAAFLLSALMIIAAAFFLSLLNDPLNAVVPTALFILYLSSFVGGILSSWLSGGILSPCAAGLISTGIILLLSIAFPGKSDVSAGIKVISFLSVELSFLLGGASRLLIATKSSGRKSRRRRRK